MSDQLIARSSAAATIRAPLSAIDLADWVFTLRDDEYQACSKNHVAAAATFAPDGKRMSINVEHVGNLMVQHYIEDIAERGAVRLVSLSDSIGPDIGSKTKIRVIWSFAVEAADAQSCKFTNTVEVRSTPEYFEALEKRGVSFEQASAGTQQITKAHNEEETPLFAKNIESKATARHWG